MKTISRGARYNEECTDVEIKKVAQDTKVSNYIISLPPSLCPTLLLLVAIPPRPLEQLDESLGLDLT